jgi:hypothetical protein
MHRLVQRHPQDARQRGNPEQGRVAGNGVGPASSARARQLTPEALKKAPRFSQGALLFCDSEGASTIGNRGSQRKEANDVRIWVWGLWPSQGTTGAYDTRGRDGSFGAEFQTGPESTLGLEKSAAASSATQLSMLDTRHRDLGAGYTISARGLSFILSHGFPGAGAGTVRPAPINTAHVHLPDHHPVACHTKEPGPTSLGLTETTVGCIIWSSVFADLFRKLGGFA